MLPMVQVDFILSLKGQYDSGDSMALGTAWLRGQHGSGYSMGSEEHGSVSVCGGGL